MDDSEIGAARDQLVQTSLVRLVDQERQRFRLHALLREQLVQSAPKEALQSRHVEALEELFADWESRWKECRECLSEVIPVMQWLRDHDTVGRMGWLAYWGFETGRRVGELEAALRILQEEERFWESREGRDAKDGLQRNYGNQALILKAWGQLDAAMALHKKQEALCEELGLKSGLGYCYWSWGLLARAQNNPDMEREKLQAAYQIFADLNMPKKQETVRKEFESIQTKE